MPRSRRSRPSPAAPDFANTIAALELSGRTLARVEQVVRPAGRRPQQRGAAGDRAHGGAADRQPLEQDPYQRGPVRPHRGACCGKPTRSALTAEQARVLERYDVTFRRAGAGLPEAARRRLAQIGERLAETWHGLQPERARRRTGLRAGARTARRTSPVSPARRS